MLQVQRPAAGLLGVQGGELRPLDPAADEPDARRVPVEPERRREARAHGQGGVPQPVLVSAVAL